MQMNTGYPTGFFMCFTRVFCNQGFHKGVFMTFNTPGASPHPDGRYHSGASHRHACGIGGCGSAFYDRSDAAPISTHTVFDVFCWPIRSFS